jgi:hypothetical protein
MPTKTTSLKKTAAAAVTAVALAVIGSLAFAAPAFADPTPAPGPVTTISNLVVGIDNSFGRQVHIQYNYSVADPTLGADSIVEVTDFANCDSPTVIDQDVPLPNTQAGAISLYVAVPATGYVEVKVYSSNGVSAPLVSLPVVASDTLVSPSDISADLNPDTPPTTGTVVIDLGGDVPESSFQLYSNGSPTGPVITVPGCGEYVHSYSGAPGDLIMLHNVDGDFDLINITIPGAVSPPVDPGTPTDPTLPTTGVGPGSWYAGGFGLAALFVGAVLLLVQWRVRRRRVV